jgi:hypothetical protein
LNDQRNLDIFFTFENVSFFEFLLRRPERKPPDQFSADGRPVDAPLLIGHRRKDVSVDEFLST